MDEFQLYKLAHLEVYSIGEVAKILGKMWGEIGRDRLQGSSHTRHTRAKAKGS